MYRLHQFKKLPTNLQVEHLSLHGIALDLAYAAKSTEAVLFAYHDFYVELIVEKYTDEILAVKCFKCLRKLEPYLNQVDISEIETLLSDTA